jgi:hypothetical protein
MKEITIKLNEFILKDKASGKTMTVQTVRTLEELYGYIEESERGDAQWKVERALGELYGQKEDES